MYVKDWNEVVDVVESFTQDILLLFDYDSNEYDKLFDILSKDIAYYTLLVLRKFS